MTPFFVPWTEAAVLLPLIGAGAAWWQKNPEQARRISLLASGLTLLLAAGAGITVAVSGEPLQVDQHWGLATSFFTVDGLSAPLLPLVSLLYFLTVLATLGVKVRRFSFSSMLVSESILLATLSSTNAWMIVALLALGTVPPLMELTRARRPVRVVALHMALFIVLLVAGQALVAWQAANGAVSIAGVTLLMLAVLIRSGILPAHCWMPELFDAASFGTALLFVTPMVGVYAAMRLVFPIAPEWVLSGIASLSLVTALYAAGMALVQREVRRMFCYLFLSHSSLVFVGLEMATPVGVTAALCAWFSVTLSMAGFGLSLRVIEARTGRLSLDTFHGLFAHTPRVAALFLLTGLAAIGFPGTIGFIGTELLVDGAVQRSPLVGVGIVVAAALNSLAVVFVYFRVFTGAHHRTTIDLRSRPAERIAVLILGALIVGGGIYPQPGVLSRYRVAKELVSQRFGPPPRTVAVEESGLAALPVRSDLPPERP